MLVVVGKPFVLSMIRSLPWTEVKSIDDCGGSMCKKDYTKAHIILSDLDVKVNTSC